MEKRGPRASGRSGALPRARQWLLGAAASWRRRLERVPAYGLLERTLREFGKDEGLDRAGAMAYYALLSIFPLLLGLISLLGFLLPSEAVRRAVSEALTQVLPGSSQLIQQNLDDIIRLRGVTGIIGLLALIWSGSSLFAAVGRAIDHAWDITRRRKLYIRKLREIGMVFGGGLLFLLSMAASTAISFFGRLESSLFFWIVALGTRAAAFLLVLLVFLLIYKTVPNTRTTWHVAWPGALLAAVFFEVGRSFFIFYLTRFANFQMVYGSLASVIVLLVWVYVSAVIMLLGVEFNSEYARMRRDI
jgi:membrane protein